MKFMLSLALVVASTGAFADSPRTGPYVQKQVGRTASGNYTYCLVTPTSVETTRVVKGVKQPTASEGATFDAAEFATLVTDAKKTPVVTGGLHFTVTNPPVSIVAGNAPDVANFSVYHDESRISVRNNAAARTLTKRANDLCGSLTDDEE